jgi:transcriptional regulator with XRE-family HTH domain
MNLAEIQSFRQIGRHLRNAREAQGLTLPTIACSCGLAISELVRIENGELMGFKQIPKDTLNNAEAYAKALDIGLGGMERQSAGFKTMNAKNNNEVFIPIFLRKK